MKDMPLEIYHITALTLLFAIFIGASLTVFLRVLKESRDSRRKTLRDRLAMEAMKQILANVEHDEIIYTADDIADKAYDVAREMLRKRENLSE